MHLVLAGARISARLYCGNVAAEILVTGFILVRVVRAGVHRCMHMQVLPTPLGCSSFFAYGIGVLPFMLMALADARRIYVQHNLCL